MEKMLTKWKVEEEERSVDEKNQPFWMFYIQFSLYLKGLHFKVRLQVTCNEPVLCCLRHRELALVFGNGVNETLFKNKISSHMKGE